jgi:hypothetical protein
MTLDLNAWRQRVRQERIVLNNRFPVKATFFRLIRVVVTLRLHDLPSDSEYTEYTEEQLLGGLSSKLGKKRRRTAERCIAYMAEHGQLPLEQIKGKRPFEYRRKK